MQRTVGPVAGITHQTRPHRGAQQEAPPASKRRGRHLGQGHLAVPDRSICARVACKSHLDSAQGRTRVLARQKAAEQMHLGGQDRGGVDLGPGAKARERDTIAQQADMPNQ